MAGMTCYHPGERCRLIHRHPQVPGRQDEPKGFGRCDFRDLIVRARVQLGGPIVLLWDNVRIHLAQPPRGCIAANADWLAVFQPPTSARSPEP